MDKGRSWPKVNAISIVLVVGYARILCMARSCDYWGRHPCACVGISVMRAYMTSNQKRLSSCSFFTIDCPTEATCESKEGGHGRSIMWIVGHGLHCNQPTYHSSRSLASSVGGGGCYGGDDAITPPHQRPSIDSTSSTPQRMGSLSSSQHYS